MDLTSQGAENQFVLTLMGAFWDFFNSISNKLVTRAHLKPEVITFSQVCNACLWCICKPLVSPDMSVLMLTRASCVSILFCISAHIQTLKWATKTKWCGCSWRGMWNHNQYPQTVFVLIFCLGISTNHHTEHKSWINSIFHFMWFNKLTCAASKWLSKRLPHRVFFFFPFYLATQLLLPLTSILCKAAGLTRHITIYYHTIRYYCDFSQYAEYWSNIYRDLAPYF